LSNLPVAWLTPKFEASDPLIPRTMQLRPSEWVVVFAVLEWLANSYNWVQADPLDATVEQVTQELIYARTVLEKGASMYIGEIQEFATEDPPEGWLRCTGAVYANVDYPLLAAVIHNGYVVDADHFRVPDRVRRLGMDDIYPGMQEGSETHTNTVAELAPHHHTYDKTIAAASTVLGELPGIELGAYASTDTGTTGSGTPYSILNPVEGTQFYIRAAWPTAG